MLKHMAAHDTSAVVAVEQLRLPELEAIPVGGSARARGGKWVSA